MKKRKNLGLFSILIGIGFLSYNFSITGAIIETNSISRPEFILGFAFLIGGFVLVTFGKNLSGLVDSKELGTRFKSIEPDLDRRSIVLDSSMIFNYSPAQLVKDLKEYGEIFVPEKVLGEIKNHSTRQIIEENSKKAKGFEEYREMAQDYLDKGAKNVLYETMVPILTGKKKSPTSIKEIEPLKKKIKKIIDWLKEDGRELTKENLLETMERHYKTSETDVDVLAYALQQAEDDKHAIIGQKDSDFEEAIKLIKKEDPVTGRNIDYVNNYEDSK